MAVGSVAFEVGPSLEQRHIAFVVGHLLRLHALPFVVEYVVVVVVDIVAECVAVVLLVMVLDWLVDAAAGVAVFGLHSKPCPKADQQHVGFAYSCQTYCFHSSPIEPEISL